MTPLQKNCLHANPRTCEHVTLYGKRDFVEMIELMLLRWEDSLGLSEESGLKEDVSMEYVCFCFKKKNTLLNFEDVGRGP